MPVRASLSTLKPGLSLGPVTVKVVAPKGNGGVVFDPRCNELIQHASKWFTGPVFKIYFLRLTSDQVGIPAELKHINKRRKRNQQGLPQ